VSIFLGLRTFSKFTTNNTNINKEKIIENLSMEYHISNNDFLQFLNKILTKISNNVNVNLEHENINYKLVYEVINWCT
jgi:actin-like ATPase involved in cell morphogenesis